MMKSSLAFGVFAFAVASLLFLACADDEAATTTTTSDAALETSALEDASSSTADASEAGGRACDVRDAVSSVQVRGLMAPRFSGRPDMPDPNGFNVTYNGQNLSAGQSGRILTPQICAGRATIDVTARINDALIGRVEWDVVPNVISEKGGWKDQTLPEKLLVVYGEPGAYAFESIALNYAPPAQGTWRFYVFNGLLNDTLTLRLAPWDVATSRVKTAEEDPWEAIVVTHLAAKSSMLVEVAPPVWSSVNDPQKLVAVEFWGDANPTDRRAHPAIAPTTGSPIETPLGLANWPVGTVATVFVYPDLNDASTTGGTHFVCRDPVWKTTGDCD